MKGGMMMTEERRTELEKEISEKNLAYYACDPSCGLSFLLPVDGDHTCPQCNQEPYFMRYAVPEDFE